MTSERIKRIRYQAENFSGFEASVVIECLDEIDRLQGEKKRLIEALYQARNNPPTRPPGETTLDVIAVDGGKITSTQFKLP